MSLTPPEFTIEVARFYARLISGVLPSPEPGADSNLGGQLFYVGRLDPLGRAMVVAANIAGAATLAAEPDLATQKSALRDGVVDFLVNSLDEALRILKNQVRKRETGAVCITAAPEAVEREMLERGVLPDLVRGFEESGEDSAFIGMGARRIAAQELDRDLVMVAWSVNSAPAQWLPKLDAIAMDCVSDKDWKSRRWLRLSPRYLGRGAKGVRVLFCGSAEAEEFVRRVREGVERREVLVAVEIQLSGPGERRDYRFEAKP
jgi:urocanate hydratase